MKSCPKKIIVIMASLLIAAGFIAFAKIFYSANFEASRSDFDPESSSLYIIIEVSYTDYFIDKEKDMYTEWRYPFRTKNNHLYIFGFYNKDNRIMYLKHEDENLVATSFNTMEEIDISKLIKSANENISMNQIYEFFDNLSQNLPGALSMEEIESVIQDASYEEKLLLHPLESFQTRLFRVNVAFIQLDNKNTDFLNPFKYESRPKHVTFFRPVAFKLDDLLKSNVLKDSYLIEKLGLLLLFDELMNTADDPVSHIVEDDAADISYPSFILWYNNFHRL